MPIRIIIRFSFMLMLVCIKLMFACVIKKRGRSLIYQVNVYFRVDFV